MQLTWLKQFFYPLYIYPRVTKGTRKQLHTLFDFYKKAGARNIQGGKKLKLFSNQEEDGIILKLLAALNIEKGCFVDIGSNDCINSNCANLAFNFDWSGVFIDASQRLLNIGKRNYKFFKKKQDLKFVNSFLYPENINHVVGDNVTTIDVDFMNIDIDGNDFAIWQALDCIKPKLVVIENKIEYGWNDIIVAADKNNPADRWGASLVSMTKLATGKGYTLVATNEEGFNGFYLRNDCLAFTGIKLLPLETILDIEKVKSGFWKM